ncbi:hypothetical protein ABZW38_16845 [Streptomyces bacillaris]|uniref:hypothetical protein n=1 Tax=Streptomyces bacillaris TaxID=68179 RepID=UPI00346038DA
MSMPTPEERAGEAFTEAAAEAVQTSTMAFRLMMAIVDAVRRQQQKEAGREEELPPVEKAVPEATEYAKKHLPPDIGTALMDGADWPMLAQQLMALGGAGVDLEALLPRVAEITVTVRDAVAEHARKALEDEGAGRWEAMLREAVPAGPVREAILFSPAWPDIATKMASLDEKGVDVRGVLAAAHKEGLGVEQAVATSLGTAAPATSRDALLAYGPLTTGLDVPKNLTLKDRARALVQLGVRDADARNVRMVREAMPGRERDADLMVSDRHWPLISLRMAEMESRGEPVAEHLARLMQDTSWEKGTGTLGTRLVRAAADTLTRPVGEAAGASRPVVSSAAAKATSPSVGPTKGVSVTKGGPRPAEPGVAAHRESGPAPSKGRTR